MPIADTTLANLRQCVRAIEKDARGDAPVLPFGVSALDGQLGGGGMRMNALHETCGTGTGWADDSAATLFMAGIVARVEGSVLWVIRSRDLFAPGLFQAGLDPARVIYAEARSDAELLAVMEEGLRHGSLGAVIGEAKRVSTPATRRLQMAARDGATMALLLKRPAKRDDDPFAMPSAAVTRWRVGCAPSQKAPWGGLGPACWQLECVRQRGGNPFTMTVEAPDEKGRIALPAELVDRPDHAGAARYARDAA